jgi:uncharacterized glyoxalase superfamily protein PhnB
MEWLCQAFGLEKHAVYAGEGNVIHHAQLTSGNGMIMLGSIVDSDFSKFMRQPDEIGGAETMACYISWWPTPTPIIRARKQPARRSL